jgi:plastocyanin
MRRKLWISIVAGSAMLMLIAAACSSNSGSSSGGGSTSAQTSAAGGTSGGSADITAENFDFTPTTATVKSGDSLVVANSTTDTTHTFTVIKTKINETLDPGASDTVAIDLKAGTYDFHCTIHPEMTGTLTVT